MKILVACEFSGIVRESFRNLGHFALSCDLLPSEVPGEHYQGCIFDLDWSLFDLVICHPPCTALSVSGNRYYAGTTARYAAAQFVLRCWHQPALRLALENPVGVLNTLCPQLPKPHYLQPWQYGHGETKKTGFWLRGLPPLEPTDIVPGREQRVWRLPPGPDRWKDRSRTYQGVADAMASQWGKIA